MRLEVVRAQPTYNMLGSKYIEKRENSVITRGIDTLEFGILINNYDYMLKNLIEILEDK